MNKAELIEWIKKAIPEDAIFAQCDQTQPVRGLHRLSVMYEIPWREAPKRPAKTKRRKQ